MRKVRLDRGLLQSDVAEILGTRKETVNAWEVGRNEPNVSQVKSIIEFLGYLPFSMESTSLGIQLFQARLITGKTQDQVAKLVRCSEKEFRLIELDMKEPHPARREKIQGYISRAFSTYQC